MQPHGYMEVGVVVFTSLSPPLHRRNLQPTPLCVITAYAEATERRILHGHLTRSLRLPSLTQSYGVVFLRCPPHSASLPRSCQHGKATTTTPLSVAHHCRYILHMRLCLFTACLQYLQHWYKTRKLSLQSLFCRTFITLLQSCSSTAK